MDKTYQGSCHCGAVRFECELDLAQGTSKCNCSICAKGRFSKAIAKGEHALRLLAGKDMLSEYTFGRDVIRHYFCSRCGIKTFGREPHEALGGTFYGVMTRIKVGAGAAPSRLAHRFRSGGAVRGFTGRALTSRAA
jgi:hypothetical protein